MCHVRAGKGTVGRAQETSIAEHDLKPTAHPKMVKVGRVPGPFIERIADNTAQGRSRSSIEHQLVAAPSQFVIQLLISHSGFDLGKAQGLVDLYDTIHPRADIDDDTARSDWTLEAEAAILAGTDAIERDTVLIGETDKRLHVGGRGRIYHTCWSSISTGEQVVTVSGKGFFGGIDGGVAESVTQRLEESWD